MPARTKRYWSRILAPAALTSAVAIAPGALSAELGRMVGHVDGVRFDVNGAHVWGWACQKGPPESIAVHIYAEQSTQNAANGALVVAGKADGANEPSASIAPFSLEPMLCGKWRD